MLFVSSRPRPGFFYGPVSLPMTLNNLVLDGKLWANASLG
ncbi:hypothetical protein SynROS8604_01014 [Synechococcus sp. ROS8604]|nr:hypothetical protein SynROS8604_01014 [Synechococcus sp. ROS8604]